MKKFFSMILLAALMAGILSPINVKAETVSEPTAAWAEENGWMDMDGYYTKTIDNVIYKLFCTKNKYDVLVGRESHWFIATSRSLDASGKVIIPSHIDGFPVKSIGMDTFRNNKNITECIIPEGVEFIGESAFQSCWNFEKVSLPESLKMIDGGAFYMCYALKSIEIPMGVDYVARSAFFRNNVDGTGLDTMLFEGDAPEILYTSEYTSNSLLYVDGVKINVYEGTFGWDLDAWTVLDINVMKPVGEVIDPAPPIYEPGVEEFFTDVPQGKWYVPYVQEVYEKDLMLGNGRYFNPEQIVTRASFITALYRMVDSPEVTDDSACDIFGDVETDAYYADAVCWAYNEGIATGNSYSMEFNPYSAVTRQQMAALVFRFADHLGYDVSVRGDLSSTVNPQKISAYAEDSMSWCLGTGIITGMQLTDAEGNYIYDLAPQQGATRAQMAKILVNFLNLGE